MHDSRRVKLRSYSLSELAKLYGMCRDTMRKWVSPFSDEIGVRNGRFYSITQVKIIFDRLGWPEEDEEEDNP